jgi:alkylation response protein AidB-like acyl-CoA dehydrogenase
MDLNLTSEEQAFRESVRVFVSEKLPADISHKVLNRLRLEKTDIARWQWILHERGWGAPNWPKEFGGTGWTHIEQHIFDEECQLAGAPRQLDFGLKMVAPVIMAYGSPEQQQRFLPGIASGEDWWCQGYSEPGSGSDLASLQCRAERRGDHYVVNGQKTWTTLGHFADWMFCLVRTSNEGKPQAGISFLLIDLKTPGVTVRPIIMLDGEHEVNDVFFDDVRVPVANRVGEENKGWTCAKFLLAHERTGQSAVAEAKQSLARLKLVAQTVIENGRPLIENPRFRDKIAQVEIELMAQEMTLFRVMSDPQATGPTPSLLKVRGNEILQTIFELIMQACGHNALPYLPEALEPSSTDETIGGIHAAPAAPGYFNMRKLSIFGGSNEIQRNIIAQTILGL